MATRNLMPLLESKQSVSARVASGFGDSPERLLGSLVRRSDQDVSLSISVENDPAWVALEGQVRNHLEPMRQDLKLLQAAYDACLRTTFDDAADQASRQRVATLNGQISQRLTSCGLLIRQIGAPAATSVQEGKTRANVMRGLGLELQTISGHFRNMQRQFDKTRAASGQAGEDEQPAPNHPYGDDDDGQEQQLASAHDDEERLRSIAQVASSVTALTRLFKDLDTLIIAQGTVLDCIDYNIASSLATTKQGVQHLTKGAKYQSRGGNCWKFCTLALLLMMVIFSIILGVRHHNQ